VKRSATGHRIGQDHQKAVLTDAQVRQMRAEYKPYVVGYDALAKKYGCGASTARDIVQHRTRWSA
jgi:hypothetical protein